jgi:thioredoxin reductase
VLIGGGVAGYVAAIKAGQEGMKVGNLFLLRSPPDAADTRAYR